MVEQKLEQIVMSKSNPSELEMLKQEWNLFLRDLNPIRKVIVNYIGDLKTHTENKKREQNQREFEQDLFNQKLLSLEKFNQFFNTLKEYSYLLFSTVRTELTRNKEIKKEYLKIQTRDLNLYKSAANIRDYIHKISLDEEKRKCFLEILGETGTPEGFEEKILMNLDKVLNREPSLLRPEDSLEKLTKLCKKHTKTYTARVSVKRVIRENEIETILIAYEKYKINRKELENIETEIEEHEISTKHIIKARDDEGDPYTIKFRTKATGRTLGKIVLYTLNQREEPPKDIMGIEIVASNLKKVYKEYERIEGLLKDLKIETEVEYKGFFKQLIEQKNKDGNISDELFLEYDRELNKEIKNAIAERDYNVQENKGNLLTNITLKGVEVPIEIQIKSQSVNSISTGTGPLSHDNNYYLTREIQNCDEVIKNLKPIFKHPMKIYEGLYKTFAHTVAESMGT